MREPGLTECVPRNKDGASAASTPLLGLTSGYIQRSAHLLPKQGTSYPWKVQQSYWRDYRTLKMSESTTPSWSSRVGRHRCRSWNP